MASFEFAKNDFLEKCFIFLSDSIHVNSIHVNAQQGELLMKQKLKPQGMKLKPKIQEGNHNYLNGAIYDGAYVQ